MWDVLERSLAAADAHAWERATPSVLRVSGGGARSALWNQIKADVTGLPVQQMAVPDAACLGAALLAAVGTGAFGKQNPAAMSAAATAMTHPAATFEPRVAETTLYRTLFSLWRNLYPALRSTFSQLGQRERATQADRGPAQPDSNRKAGL